MKSVFQEDSSVLRAIEKAWNTAGRPTEFTVKIIDFGKKGILGFTKKPAIISVFYNPKTQTIQPVQKEELRQEREQRKKIQPIQVQRKEEIKAEKKKKIISSKLIHWDDEFLNDVRSWLKQLLDILKINVLFDLKANKKILNISLMKDIIKTKEEEKAFFIGLSFLLMQFLKKKYRKKFDGFHIIIKSPLANNESSKSK